VTPSLLAEYDRPGPRYTSYPTAVDFHDGFGPTDYAERLADAAERPDDPLSLYVHLPFCEQRCSFCACHVVVTGHESVADAYLGRVVAEARITAAELGERRMLQQYHWGGGTPTYYQRSVLADLHRSLLSEFELAPGAEVALEVDPRVTTPEHLAVLRELGFNRLSMGVQDADQTVRRLIGRNQTWEQTAGLYDTARRLGYGSINIDLIYGLPGQSERSFWRSLDLVVGLRPDRMAVYSFALVPRMRPHQKRIDASQPPDRDQKFGLLSLGISRLTDAGYRQIGMDRFALPDDELAIAHEDRTLSPNFMGYTTKRGTEIVGLGSSAISDVADAYSQNHRHRPRSGRSAAAIRDHGTDVQRAAAFERRCCSIRRRHGRPLRLRARSPAGSGRVGRGGDGPSRRWRDRSHRARAPVHPQRRDGVRRPPRHDPR
jgi:oxygen-independent coproporphyrinogen-3 oxidase